MSKAAFPLGKSSSLSPLVVRKTTDCEVSL